MTAGIYFALTLLSEIAGGEYAQAIQLAVGYDPAPPFDAGHPQRAPESVRRVVDPIHEQATRGLEATINALRGAAC